MHTLPLPLLAVVFLAAALATWLAGTRLSAATDVLSTRLGLGEALSGMILLAIATNLPELAITVSASLEHNLALAVGNILGGIALQTVVLVFLDVFGLKKGGPLSSKAASLVIVLEGLLVVTVLALAMVGKQLSSAPLFGWLPPVETLIAAAWIGGVYLIARARKGLPWQERGFAPPDGQRERLGHSRVKKHETFEKQGITTGRVAVRFAVSAAVTLVAGVALELSGGAIATRLGIGGLLFGATILAAATALPEVATGMEAVKLHDYQLAFSDIFGGNAFLPVLFLVAALLSGANVLQQAPKADIYLAGLGILLTVVYLVGLIFRPRRQVLRMGIDSLCVLVVYVVGVLGLLFVSKG